MFSPKKKRAKVLSKIYKLTLIKHEYFKIPYYTFPRAKAINCAKGSDGNIIFHVCPIYLALKIRQTNNF